MTGHDSIPDQVVCDEIEISTLFDEFPDANMAQLALIAAERRSQS